MNKVAHWVNKRCFDLRRGIHRKIWPARMNETGSITEWTKGFVHFTFLRFFLFKKNLQSHQKIQPTHCPHSPLEPTPIGHIGPEPPHIAMDWAPLARFTHLNRPFDPLIGCLNLWTAHLTPTPHSMPTWTVAGPMLSNLSQPPTWPTWPTSTTWLSTRCIWRPLEPPAEQLEQCIRARSPTWLIWGNRSSGPNGSNRSNGHSPLATRERVKRQVGTAHLKKLPGHISHHTLTIAKSLGTRFHSVGQFCNNLLGAKLRAHQISLPFAFQPVTIEENKFCGAVVHWFIWLWLNACFLQRLARGDWRSLWTAKQ